ncbi:tRNA pseudouridine(13) synthase TruD [Gammaproteobacteria bacterium]|nr:tRNA pseudouridine(13) synthase TruD [Gammaproteobacteria bacterium]
MSLRNLAYAYSEPDISASYKVDNEDFQVKEILNFEPDGDGDHLFLYVEKNGLTTQDVQKQLMQYFDLPAKDVSFSGMKDKQALTQQWFSVKQGNGDLAVTNELNSNQLTVQRSLKNKRKLKRGSHRTNQFAIRLRDLSGKPDALIERLNRIALEGVPNYFGQQRFGRNEDNVTKAKQLFDGSLKIKDRYQRGIYISAARAYLFNQVLTRRVETGAWNSYMPGDIMSLEGTSSSFKPIQWDQVLADRLDKKDIHPSGPMWGSGELLSDDLCAALEMEVINTEADLKSGLEQIGLEQERRALRSMPRNLKYSTEDDSTILVEFSLSKGAYATSILRELVKLRPLENKSAMSAGAV